MNNRRKLVVALGVHVLAAPLASFSQQARSIPVVGVLTLEVANRVALLREGLGKLGYVEGRNIRLEERAAGDRYTQLTEIANEFVQLKADVIVALGATATLTARKVTATIPIVMVAGLDPVKEKLAASLARPGGNVTGVASIAQELSPKRLELAKEAVPGLSRVGILWNPESSSSARSLANTQEAAKALNLQLQIVEVRSASDFDKAFATLERSRTTVFVLQTSSMFAANLKLLLQSAVKHRLAGVLSAAEGIDAGALIAYGPNTAENYRHAAVFVDKILKGAKPGDLPIEQPTKFELLVNMKTAKALGIKVPNSVLVRANQVIE